MNRNRKGSAILLFVVLLFCEPEFLFSQNAGEEKFEPAYAIVLKNKVNIRAGCGLNFDVLGQLNKANRVLVTGEEYDWYKVRLPEEALCFVHKDYLEISGNRKGRVKANRLRVRAGSGFNFNVLGILKRGEAVNILAEEDDWVRIAPPKSCLGWIKKDYLKLSKEKFSSLEDSKHPSGLISKPPFKQEKKIEAEGIIDDLGKIINRRGTHKLMEGGKTLYYLKSKDLDLNLYVYQKVQVIGEPIDAENSLYPVIDVEQIKAKR